jgi:hypothetical protein
VLNDSLAFETTSSTGARVTSLFVHHGERIAVRVQTDLSTQGTCGKMCTGTRWFNVYPCNCITLRAVNIGRVMFRCFAGEQCHLAVWRRHV